jgi:glutamyl-tRNA synthetase
VIRFKTPRDGVVTFNDHDQGPDHGGQRELDDLVIVRGDGVPTYNFGVVIDDWDMGITHVIRGDDHVNNTPRQINILLALGAPIPTYAHVPMILGHDGERLSKRHGAVSVLQYREEGFLPEALLNYLARLGWGHGDEENSAINSSNGSILAMSATPRALRWQQAGLAEPAIPEGSRQRPPGRVGATVFENSRHRHSGSSALVGLISLVKERVNTVEELADGLHIYYKQSLASAEDLRAKLPKTALPALSNSNSALPAWFGKHRR